MGLFHPKPRIPVATSREVGVHAEMVIVERLIRYGYVVLAPYGGGQRYDLVIEDADGAFWRVQCKNGRKVISKGQEYIVGLEWNLYHIKYNNGRMNKNARYQENELDYYAVYYAETQSVYLVPATHVAHFKMRGYLQLKSNGRVYDKGRASLVAEEYELK